MKRTLGAVVALVAVSLFAANLLAADEAKETKKHKGHPPAQMHASQLDQMLALKELELTDEQKAKLKAVKEEYAPKFQALVKEVRGKVDEILTPEQKEQLKKARAKKERAGGGHAHDGQHAKATETKAKVQEPRKKAERQGRVTVTVSPLDRILTMQDLKLTDEQKTKLGALKTEYTAKLQNAWKATADVLTEEQKKARDAALKTAREAGKKGRELMEAAQAAVQLTDAQKAELEKAREQAANMVKELREKVNEILTPEQKDTLRKTRGQKRG